MLTQVAPAAVLTRALSNGQSATASVPSSIASVSRFGDATDPESRWARPAPRGAAARGGGRGPVGATSPPARRAPPGGVRQRGGGGSGVVPPASPWGGT